MKITWFGGRTLRIHIGGQIVVWRPAEISGVVGEELESGADLVIRNEGAFQQQDAELWQPRRASTALDPAGPGGAAIFEIGPDAVLVDTPGEGPLLLVGGVAPAAGRWAKDAVVVAFSPVAAAGALDALGPRLIALAFEGDELDRAFSDLRSRLGGTSMAALEPGLALEV